MFMMLLCKPQGKIGEKHDFRSTLKGKEQKQKSVGGERREERRKKGKRRNILCYGTKGRKSMRKAMSFGVPAEGKEQMQRDAWEGKDEKIRITQYG